MENVEIMHAWERETSATCEGGPCDVWKRRNQEAKDYFSQALLYISMAKKG